MVKQSLILIALIALSISVAASQPKPEAQANCEDQLGFIKTDENGLFQGFTEPALRKIEPQVENLQVTEKNSRLNFEGMDAIFQLDYLTLLTKQNALIGGPRGGAKSQHLHWLLPKEKTFKRLINNMTSLGEVLGGQTTAGFDKGIEELNFENSLVSAEYGMLEELTKGNGSLIGGLYTLLNPSERFLLYQMKERPTQLKSIFATTNLSRAEIIAQGLLNDADEASPMINRFMHSAWVGNWPTYDEMVRLDGERLQRNRLQILSRDGTPEVRATALAELKRFEARDVDWTTLERFSRNVFVPSQELSLGAIRLARGLRAKAVAKKRKSEINQAKEPENFRWIDEPDADWVERLRANLMNDILNSAALDYLSTHSAEQIAALRHPIVLGIDSLWRAVFTATTITSGALRYDVTAHKVLFNLSRDIKGQLKERPPQELIDEASSESEARTVSNLIAGQNAFNTELKEIIELVQNSKKPIVPELAMLSLVRGAIRDVDEVELNYMLGNPSFEIEISKLKDDSFSP